MGPVVGTLWFQEKHGQAPPERSRLDEAQLNTRTEMPYQGVQRAPVSPTLRFGAVPNTEDGLGHVVACSYWIEEERRTVRCDNVATLDRPL